MIKKLFITLISLALFIQITGMLPKSIYAASNDKQVSIQDVKNETNKADTINVSISGVEKITQGEIFLGDIIPITYDGYNFVNATVDGAVVNYVGIYEGEYYYANTSNNDSGAYLLGNLKIQLNYEKIIKSYAIEYSYDKDVLKVVGAQTANENTSSKFRIEMLNEDYQVNSVKVDTKVLISDDDGYYTIDNVNEDIRVDIVSQKITEYQVNVKKDYIKDATYSGANSIAVGETWTGIITSSKWVTLNSIIVNNQYLNIPSGGKIYSSETKTTVLSDGTKIDVNVSRKNDWDPHIYTITVYKVKSNLNIIPSIFNDNKCDITMTSIQGLNVYHWNGTKLDSLSMGDRVDKNKDTDYFFVRTQPGYEAQLTKLNGEGTKIIERIDDVSFIPEKTLEAAKKAGCHYVFYYSDKSVEHRTVSIESQLINYSVKYDLNGGNEKIVDNDKYDIINKKIISVSSITPTKDNYTFTGWKLTDSNITYKEKSEIIINERLVNVLKSNTVNLVAQWIKNEDIKTASYQVQYYFQQSNGEFIENKDYRKIINNASIGATAILMDKDPIGEYEFDASNQLNALKTKVYSDNQTTPLKAYYVKAVRTIGYIQGNSKPNVGSVPVDFNNPYKKGTQATILDNVGNLVGNYDDVNKAKFACWISATDNKYYFPGDKAIMNDHLELSPVFVGDLSNGQALTFVAGDNGVINGQSQFAVPSNNKFGKVITDKYKLPTVNANMGYAFEGWYVGNKKVATDATSLYNYVKDLSATTKVEARFKEDSTQRHDISYQVKYYKGDTLEDAKKANPEVMTIEENDVWINKDMLSVKDIEKNKYQGYKLDSTSPKSLPSTIKNGSVIDVYYVKDMTKWTAVEFNAGNLGHGMINGNMNNVIFKDVMIGMTFLSQNINIPTITPNDGWIFNDWDIEVSDETVITDNMVITAQYLEDRNQDGIPDVNQYIEVVFNAGEFGDYNGQKEVSIKQMLPSDEINIPVLNVVDGYSFTRYNSEVLKTIPKGLDVSRLEYTALYIVTPTNPGEIIPPIVIIPPMTPEIPLLPNAPIEPVTPVVPDAPVVGVVNVPVVDNPALIAPNEVPQGNGNDVVDENQTIDDTLVPQAKLDGTWALVNLISVITTLVLAAILFILKNKKDEQDSKTRILEIAGALIAFIAVVVFFVTEDISLKMIMTDNWTIAMLALAIIQVVLIALKKMKK